MNEDLQAALSDLENRFCSCSRLTTSNKFWLGDHSPNCDLVTNMDGDGVLLAEIKRLKDALTPFAEAGKRAPKGGAVVGEFFVFDDKNVELGGGMLEWHRFKDAAKAMQNGKPE